MNLNFFTDEELTELLEGSARKVIYSLANMMEEKAPNCRMITGEIALNAVAANLRSNISPRPSPSHVSNSRH